MKKRTYRNRKAQEKRLTYIFGGVLIATAILLIVLIIIRQTTPAADPTYVVTADGHVHTSDGLHIGTYDELFGDNGYVVTEDGHVHAEDGTHIGTYEGDVSAATGEIEPTSEPATEEE